MDEFYSPANTRLYPRSAADVYAYGNDATLSTFTLGGQDVLALSGIVVANPATDPGATLHVDNFTGFAGIVAAATSAKATFAITLSRATVDPANTPPRPMPMATWWWPPLPQRMAP